MRHVLLFSFAISLLLSCNSPTEQQDIDIEETGFNAMVAIKNNDREKLYTLFDQDLLANTSSRDLDNIVVESKKLLDKYPIPNFEVWKNTRLFYQLDTLSRTIQIGVPLSPQATGTVEYYFAIKFSPTNKITSINIVQVPTANHMPDSEFPAREEKFNYTLDSLESIRLYYLPGNNNNPDSSKSIEFTDKQFSSQIKKDFGSVLSKVNASKIINVAKITSQQQPTNELKAIIFSYKRNQQNKQRSLFLLSTKENPLEIHTFYVVNATYAYKLTESDNKSLKADIDHYIKKYIK